ncbi:unnamed protein product, partial [Heterosigma akashiwo]
LAAATPEQQKAMIGERLYVLIEAHQLVRLSPLAATFPKLCGKITGMLLQGMENGELLHLLEAPAALAAKIAEALFALEEHTAAPADRQA